MELNEVKHQSSVSKDVPLARPLISRHHLMGSPPDVRVLIPIKLAQSFVHPILQSFGTSITDDMEYSLPDPCILVTDEFEDAFPEDVNVLLDFAGAKLLDGLESDITVLGVGVLQDHINVIRLPADAHQLPLVRLTQLLRLLLIVLALPHPFIIWKQLQTLCKDKFFYQHTNIICLNLILSQGMQEESKATSKTGVIYVRIQWRVLDKAFMSDPSYPVPFSHRTFELGGVIIDSNFDSGNLYNAEKVNSLSYNLWVAVDHPKNQYRSWFHFSVGGLKKGNLVTFTIKNMQNQSKLLNEGLVPVRREEGSQEWRRVAYKVDLNKIEYNQGWIEWPFRHTLTSDSKIFFAFFYPWSNLENSCFLSSIEEKCKAQDDVYFKRSTVIRSFQGRPVQFITISSKRGIYTKNQQFDDEYLFADGSQPKEFLSDKKAFVIGARVHPGQVPSSHVMTGIINQLTEDTQKARLLRDKFVFYLFPIFNPDGVARGHYRVDPNGINLNRCYINPNPKNHSPIYAVKKIILHFHEKGKFFGFLDLHAHAARKGVFIYGNACNQLEKQTEICLFPKILSMNSEIFEYEGSNFTQKNMYCKDVNDHVSKEGAGRVALFKATKNPYSWTLQCNYNTSRIINTLEERRDKDDPLIRPNEKQLDSALITTYKNPTPKEPKQFYKIETFRQLGREICESLLDLVELNPESRIDNPKSYFKSVQNLKLNLAVALLRMAPTRFESPCKKIYYYLEGASSSKELEERSVRALYLMLIKKAKIQNMNAFLKEGDESSIVLPQKPKRQSMSPVREQSSPSKAVIVRPASKDVRIRLTSVSPQSMNRQNNNPSQQPSTFLKLTKISHDIDIDSEDSEGQTTGEHSPVYLNLASEQSQPEKRQFQILKTNPIFNSHLLQMNLEGSYQRVFGKHQEMGLDLLRSYRKSINNQIRKLSPISNYRMIKSTVEQLPTLAANKVKAVVSIASLASPTKIPRRRSNNQGNVLFVAND